MLFSQRHFRYHGSSTITRYTLVLVAALVLVACSLRPTPTYAPPNDTTISTPTPTPLTVAEILVQGEGVPFEVCAEASTWVRPSEEDQTSKKWELGRYAGVEEEVLKYPWTHNFFVVYGHSSIEYDVVNLSGLWKLTKSTRTAVCWEGERRDAIRRLQMAEVWVLLHTVREIKRVGTSYAIIVEPVEKGVQFVQFPRPVHQLPLTLYFVTQDGHEIDKIVEADYRYWPYPQFIPTTEP